MLYKRSPSGKFLTNFYSVLFMISLFIIFIIHAEISYFLTSGLDFQSDTFTSASPKILIKPYKTKKGLRRPYLEEQLSE